MRVNVQTRGVPTFRYGPDFRDLFIIAEAPGKTEDEEGEPMVGSAGNIGRTLLASAGLRSYCIGNCVRCRPPENRIPEPLELQICLQHVYSEIAKVKPKVLLLMGKTAAQAILGTRGSMARLRGWHKKVINGHECQVYGTYHPSLLHYDPDKQRPLEDDLALVARFLRGEPLIENLHDIGFKWKYCDTLDKLREAAKITLTWKGHVGLDFETPGLARVNVCPTTLAWGSLVDGKPTVFSVPLEHPNSPWTADEYQRVKLILRKMHEGLIQRHETGDVQLTAHGAKFESCQYRDWIKLSIPKLSCTQQLAHTIDENRLAGGKKGVFTLETLTNAWLGISSDIWDGKVSDMIYGGRILECDVKKVCLHDAKDVAVQTMLRAEIDRRAEAQGYAKGLQQIQPLLQRLPFLLSAIERNGMPVDVDYLSELRSNSSPLLEQMEKILADLNEMPAVRKTVRRLRGGSRRSPLFGDSYGWFKITGKNSRDYLDTLFFGVLQLPQEEETKTGMKKVDKEFFEKYKEVPEVAMVAEYRSLDTLVTRYLSSWWDFCKASHDTRIRANFNSTGTVTGRLSANNPNLQQIPRGKTAGAKIIKKVFRPTSTDRNHPRIICSCDFSQAELRWLAEVSGDKAMSNIFIKRAELLDQYANHPSEKLAKRIDTECDLHRATYASMYGKPISEVTGDDRNIAKALNFGIGYGMGEEGLSVRLNCSVEEAALQLEKWMQGFSGARDWFEEIEKFAAKHGYVDSPIGRRRHLDALLLGLAHGSARGHLLRVARNSPIQSVASDMTLWVAAKIEHYIEKHNKPWLLCALVHDSIISEIPLDDALEYVEIARGIAEDRELLKKLGYSSLRVPMEFEGEIGPSYGQLTKLTVARSEQEKVVEEIQAQFRQAA